MDAGKEGMQKVGVTEGDVRAGWRQMIHYGDPNTHNPKEEELKRVTI